MSAVPHYRGPSHGSASTNKSSYSSLNGGDNMQRNNNRDRVDEANLTLMELENNQRWAELGEQVDLLKELSNDINTEVKSQNRMLDGMGDAFGSTTELFKSTIGKLGVMLTNPSSKHMYYLMGFIVFVFLVLYFMMSRKSSS